MKLSKVFSIFESFSAVHLGFIQHIFLVLSYREIEQEISLKFPLEILLFDILMWMAKLWSPKIPKPKSCNQ
jgi:hypothetical protein